MVKESTFVLFCFLNGGLGSELQAQQSHPKKKNAYCFNKAANCRPGFSQRQLASPAPVAAGTSSATKVPACDH